MTDASFYVWSFWASLTAVVAVLAVGRHRVGVTVSGLASDASLRRFQASYLAASLLATLRRPSVTFIVEPVSRTSSHSASWKAALSL